MSPVVNLGSQDQDSGSSDCRSIPSPTAYNNNSIYQRRQAHRKFLPHITSCLFSALYSPPPPIDSIPPCPTKKNFNYIILSHPIKLYPIEAILFNTLSSTPSNIYSCSKTSRFSASLWKILSGSWPGWNMAVLPAPGLIWDICWAVWDAAVLLVLVG